MLSVGGLLGSAFRWGREHPAIVATWLAFYAAVNIPIVLLLQDALRTWFATLALGQQPSAGMVATFYGGQFLILLAMLIVFAAVLRAILRPDDARFAYLRFGGDELRLVGLALIYVAAGLVLMIALMLIAILISGLATVMFGSGSTIVILLAFVLFAAASCLTIWITIRLSLAGALVNRSLASQVLGAVAGGIYAALYTFVGAGCVAIATRVLIEQSPAEDHAAQ